MVTSWFINLIPILDRMPDQAWLQVPAADRVEVYNWYCASCVEQPGVYLRTTYSYFCRIWRKSCPTIRLRKYLRFSKCRTCTQLKAEKTKHRGRGNHVPAELKKRMAEHYQKIYRCRAGAMNKALLAMNKPGDFISIAQDATDCLGWGYPKGAETTHKEDNNKLKAKVMISMVHGAAVYMYIMPDDVENGPDESIECLQRTLQHEEERRGHFTCHLVFAVRQLLP